MATIKKIKDLKLDEILSLVADPERRRLHSEILKNLAAKNDSGYAWTNDIIDSPDIVYDARAQMVEGIPFYILEDRRLFKRQLKTDVDKVYHEILASLMAGKDITYLDVGCADGSRTKEFAEALNCYCNVKSIIALDLSPELIALARTNLLTARVDVADICNLPEEFSGSSDLVSCIYGVVGHVPEDAIQTAFDNLFRVAKPGGYIVLDVLPNEGSDKKYQAYYPKAIDKDIDFIVATDDGGIPLISTARHFAPDEICQYALNSGFELIQERIVVPAKEHLKTDKDYGEHYILVLRRPETETKLK